MHKYNNGISITIVIVGVFMVYEMMIIMFFLGFIQFYNNDYYGDYNRYNT